MVQVLKANGNPHEVIAMVIGISADTLAKHYRKQLDDGKAQVKAMMGAAVVKSGLGGNIGAQRYWLACFGGPEWKVPKEEVSGGGGETTIIVRGGIASVKKDDDEGGE